MADLFTEEFYRTAALKLRPGGIFCQWVQCYQTSPRTLETIFRTLTTRFPHGQLFFVDGSADLIILASPDREVGLDLDRIAHAWDDSTVAAQLARVGVASPGDLLPLLPGPARARRHGRGPGPDQHGRQRMAGAPCSDRSTLGSQLRGHARVVAAGRDRSRCGDRFRSRASGPTDR